MLSMNFANAPKHFGGGHNPAYNIEAQIFVQRISFYNDDTGLSK